MTLTLDINTLTFPELPYIILQPLNQLPPAKVRTLEHELKNGHFKPNSQQFSIDVFISITMFVLYQTTGPSYLKKMKERKRKTNRKGGN